MINVQLIFLALCDSFLTPCDLNSRYRFQLPIWSIACPSTLQKLAVQAPSIRMGLRSYRSSLPVPIETSSSSDDSCDSFGSDGGFANTVSTECGHNLCQTVVHSDTPLKTDVSAVEEHGETEQDDNFKTKDYQGSAGRGRVQWIRWERDKPSDGVDGQFTVPASRTTSLTVFTLVFRKNNHNA